MKTIIIKVQSTIESEREIKLPMYVMDNCHVYKIISKDKCIQICHGLNSGLSIGYCDPSLALRHLNTNAYGSHQIDEIEFNKKYSEINEKLLIALKS